MVVWEPRPILHVANTSFESLFSTIHCESTQLRHCMYGSSRRKLTRLIHNIPSFHQLHQMCDNQHEHEPWGQKPDGSWATSEETAYPWPLARAIAAQVVLQLQDQGLVCHLPSFAEQECTLQAMRAATNIQPRKNLPPIVPELKQVIHQNSQTHRLLCQHDMLGYSALPNGGMSRAPKKATTTKSRWEFIFHLKNFWVKRFVCVIQQNIIVCSQKKSEQM